MKKFGAFALVVCLLVLAIAVVLGVTYPGMQEGQLSFLGNIGKGIATFFEHVWEGLVAAFKHP